MLTAIRRLPLFLASVAVIFFGSFAVPVFAQSRPSPYQGAWSDEAQYRAYDKGYRKGEDQGRDDAKHNRAFDYTRDKDYRKADDGYKDRYGDRVWYANEFRRGYVAGYTRAYNDNAPRGYYGNRGYGNGYGYPAYEGRAVPRPAPRYDVRGNAGFNRGYQDGLDKGRDDLRRNRRYDPRRFDWYEDGDRGYHREYGPKSEYVVSYRQGFLDGYAAGYRNEAYRDRRW